jgi:hypothetical protein
MNRTTNKNEPRVLRTDNEAGANDGNRIRNILILGNHPATLRLLREIYSDSAGPTLSQYYLLIIALVILGLAVAIVWFT